MNRRTMPPVTRRSTDEYRLGRDRAGSIDRRSKARRERGGGGRESEAAFSRANAYISERENAKFNRVNDNVYSAYVRWIFPRLFAESGNIERDKHDNLSTKWRQFNEATHPSSSPPSRIRDCKLRNGPFRAVLRSIATIVMRNVTCRTTLHGLNTCLRVNTVSVIRSGFFIKISFRPITSRALRRVTMNRRWTE